MAEFESPKQKSPKKRNKKGEKLLNSSQVFLNKETPSLKRKWQSSSDDEGASKKPKSAESKVTNGQVTSPAANSSSKWTFEEENELLDKVQEYLTNREDSNEGKKTIYIKDIEWIKIDSGDHTTEEAQQRFLLISKNVRKLRTANEILKDMKEYQSKKKKTREKKEIPSDITKKPLTPYFRFVMAKRHVVMERYPELKSNDVSRKLGSKWNKLSEAKKKKYNDKYQEEMEDYNLQVIEYLKTHNPGMSPPKKKFELWSEEETKKIRADRPDIAEKKLAKKLKRRWENLEEEEKSQWEEKEKKEFKRFKDRISKRSRNKSKQEQKLGSSSEEKIE